MLLLIYDGFLFALRREAGCFATRGRELPLAFDRSALRDPLDYCLGGGLPMSLCDRAGVRRLADLCDSLPLDPKLLFRYLDYLFLVGILRFEGFSAKPFEILFDISPFGALRVWARIFVPAY